MTYTRNKMTPVVLSVLMASGLYAEANIAKPAGDNMNKSVSGKKYTKVMVRLKKGFDPVKAYRNFIAQAKIQPTELQLRKSFALAGKKAGLGQKDKKHILILQSPTLAAETMVRLARMIRGVDVVEVAQPITIDSTTIPNDPDFGDLWGMDNAQDTDIDAPEAWSIARGSASVTVGIIDTGINYTHPDLAHNVWTNPNEIAGNGIDDDGNGYVDDIHGIDVVNDDSDSMDDNKHGSHCAGTIGAEGNNSVGVVGVNWNTSIAGCKFLNASGSGYSSGAVECVNYFNDLKLNHGVNIVVTNNSWGGGGYSQLLHDAITEAQDAGILFAAAAGNDGNNIDNQPSYPAGYDVDNVIAVAATDNNDILAYFSNYGVKNVDLAAPGVSILSTVLGTGYSYLSGTSMATPHVTGAVALMASAFPDEDITARKQRILDSVDPVTGLTGKVATGGRLNLHNALTMKAPTVKADFNGDGISDILWKTGTGEHVIWIMDAGGGHADDITLGASELAVRGIGDLDGNGVADILWQVSDSSHTMWLMQSDGTHTAVDIGGSALDAQGVADFNKDGRDDIIWRDAGGDYVIWYMDAAGPVSTLSGESHGFLFEGTGDFNADGIADLLLSSPSGTKALCFMNTNGVSSVVNIGGEELIVDQVADFTGNGTDDILLHNSTNSHIVWTVNASGKTGTTTLGGTTYTAVAVGDYDGDAVSDILVRNNNGDHVVVLSNGDSVKNTVSIGAEGWLAQP